MRATFFAHLKHLYLHILITFSYGGPHYEIISELLQFNPVSVLFP
jgi:hypothetical protein